MQIDAFYSMKYYPGCSAMLFKPVVIILDVGHISTGILFWTINNFYLSFKNKAWPTLSGKKSKILSVSSWSFSISARWTVIFSPWFLPLMNTSLKISKLFTLGSPEKSSPTQNSVYKANSKFSQASSNVYARFILISNLTIH